MSENQQNWRENDTQLKDQIALLKEEFDSLQVHVMEAAKPWYKQAATLIAALALVFSFGTTVVSYVRIGQQDRHQAQVELRTLIQKLLSLSKDGFLLSDKYRDDPIALNAISSHMNAENIILSNQALSLASKIPDLVTSAEYYSVANAFANSGNLSMAEALYLEAANRASDPTALTGALRSLGLLAYNVGDIEKGRRYYHEAMEVFSERLSDAPLSFQHYTHFHTKINWARAEVSVGNCKMAEAHAKDAKRFGAAQTFDKDSWVLTLTQVEEAIQGCRQAVEQAPE